MRFLRTYTGLIAAVLVAMFGVVTLYMARQPAFAALIFVVGGAAAAWQINMLQKSRRDRYDLSRLWDRDEDEEEAGEPDEDWQPGEDTAYCHRCGHAVAQPFARCPDCGQQLR